MTHVIEKIKKEERGLVKNASFFDKILNRKNRGIFKRN